VINDALGTAERRCIREGFQCRTQVSWGGVSQEATRHDMDVMTHIYGEPLNSAQET
jgi:hypothetical protein